MCGERSAVQCFESVAQRASLIQRRRWLRYVEARGRLCLERCYERPGASTLGISGRRSMIQDVISCTRPAQPRSPPCRARYAFACTSGRPPRAPWLAPRVYVYASSSNAHSLALARTRTAYRQVPEANHAHNVADKVQRDSWPAFQDRPAGNITAGQNTPSRSSRESVPYKPTRGRHGEPQERAKQPPAQ